MAATQIADIIVPSIFTTYTQNLTEVKSRLIRSGAVVRDTQLDALLAGGGSTFNEPSFRDLADDAENVSTDDPNTNSTPKKTGALQEIQCRLSRNQSWSSMDLTGDLAGADPQGSISNRVSDYWVRRQQDVVIATLKGVFADNDAAPVGTEHVQYDLRFNAAGAAFADGVTNFTSSAFIDACTTMGDSMESLRMIIVHSIVYSRMLKAQLIDFIPDAINPNGARIPTFLGRTVIVDDNMPNSGGVFESWLFGAGAIRFGVGNAKVPTEVWRNPAAGNGGGQEVLHNRVEWCFHPVGHQYAGTYPTGGPTNAATANNLAHADSWKRVFPERKQIPLARLITREY